MFGTILQQRQTNLITQYLMKLYLKYREGGRTVGSGRVATIVE